MCGIAAMIAFDRPVAPEALHAATDALAHRGPDGTVRWLSDDRRVGLGHTRLSIIDPTGIQPIASEDGQRRIVANGEFYGFDSIRGELERRGHRFRTRTDTEIALHLYEDLGERCLERLRGEFAFILWDEAEEAAFAARDRFGVKPLFYATRDGVLHLASEAKALFAAGVFTAWDHDAVYQSLHGCYAQDYSPFRGIRQLPPGHYLKATRSGVRISRYWDVDYPRRGADGVPESECIAEVRRLLEESIRLRMRADVPVGYLLSGGIDSSTMLAVAAARSEKPLTAFTIAFSSDRYDESRAARAAADHVGAELVELRVTDADVADNFADSVWHGEGMHYNAHGAARFLLSRTIQASGYRSVMGGEGADEVFAGYGFVRNAALGNRSTSLAKALLSFVRPLGASERAIAQTSPLLARGTRVVDLPAWTTDRAVDWLLALRSVLAPEFLAEFQDRDPYRTFVRRIDFRRNLLGREPAKKILYVWLRSIFANYHLGADRIDMAHAVEVRLPYLDHVLFEYARRIPVAMLAKEDTQKYVLREAARPYVSDAVYRGPKKPFFAPPSAVHAGTRLHDFVQDTVRSEAMSSVPFFDVHAAKRLLDRMRTLDESRRATIDPILMMMASVCVLHDRFRL
jgi:asparagine synthase (glutamine-hydrolysing)